MNLLLPLGLALVAVVIMLVLMPNHQSTQPWDSVPVNKEVSEDGFMSCAEHGPYHVDDSEAFQCPACGAALKLAPVSQGAGTVCSECEACDWEADTSNYRGPGSDGPDHTCKPAATKEN